ncbi:MAG: hypothetical protein OXN80_08665 [bacterium]|nr:hypothetical protein [bacterium]
MARLTRAGLRLMGFGLAVVFAAACGSGDDPSPPVTSTEPTAASTTSTVAAAGGVDEVSGEARSLLDVWRSAVLHSDGVWPGYDLAAIPTVLVTLDAGGGVAAVVAFSHPDPEGLGSEIRHIDVDGHRVAIVGQVADPNRLASMAPFDFFADIGGADTFVLVGQRGEPGREPGTPEFIAMVVHEAFHRYQFDEWAPDAAFQDVAGYDFSHENLEMALLENRILIAAYQADTPAETERLAHQFVAVRAARHQRDARVVLDEQQERMEGSARWIEHRIGDAIGNLYTSANHTSEVGLLDRNLDDPMSVLGSVKSFFGFGRFYSSGATQLELLDRLGVPVIDVSKRLRDGGTPAQLLAQRVEPLDDVEALVVAARTEHDPGGRLGREAATLAELAASEEAPNFGGGDDVPDTPTGGFELSDDQIACLQEHGLDLSGDVITIPDEVDRACFGGTEP